MNDYRDFYKEYKMKCYFEIHTTVSKPIIVSFDKDLPMSHCYNEIINEIEYNTILTEDAVIDIFAEDTLSNNTVSLLSGQGTNIGDFIVSNRNFFPFTPVTKNLYNIFVIDKMYLTKINEKDIIPACKKTKKEIITNHWTNIVNQTKRLIYL
jgi:hypothetical protein